MKCIICENWSLKIICNTCQRNLLSPSLYKREIDNNFFVYSFYGFEEIEELLKSKYYFHGDKIFQLLAKNAFSSFAKAFSYDQEVLSIGIDDHTKHDFSHTAILNKHLTSQCIRPIFNHLKAQNHVQYAGKDLEFRHNNPRKFQLTNITHKALILVDDVVTTGSTLIEAKKECEKHENEVLFALTLADAKL